MARDDNQTERSAQVGRGERLAIEVATQIDHLNPFERDEYQKRLALEQRMRAGGGAVQGGEMAAQPYRPSGEEFTLENIDEAMTYQPMDSQQIDGAQEIRDALTFAAKAILRRAPRSARRTLALQHLINARMDANAAISFRGRF